jgi:hypothetical protein
MCLCLRRFFKIVDKHTPSVKVESRRDPFIHGKELCDTWREKHKWNKHSNSVLLLAYIENIYSLCAEHNLTSVQRLQYGVEKIIFELEVSLARINLEDMIPYKNYLEEINSKSDEQTKARFEQSIEYKLEICKHIVKIHLPGSYQHCKNRWSENKKYIETCEEMRKTLEKQYRGNISS